jgi:hypothetical protein
MTTPAQYRGLAARIRDNNYAGDKDVLIATLLFNMPTILAALDEAGRQRSTKATILTLRETEDADS